MAPRNNEEGAGMIWQFCLLAALLAGAIAYILWLQRLVLKHGEALTETFIECSSWSRENAQLRAAIESYRSRIRGNIAALKGFGLSEGSWMRERADAYGKALLILDDECRTHVGGVVRTEQPNV